MVLPETIEYTGISKTVKNSQGNIVKVRQIRAAKDISLTFEPLNPSESPVFSEAISRVSIPAGTVGGWIGDSVNIDSNSFLHKHVVAMGNSYIQHSYISGDTTIDSSDMSVVYCTVDNSKGSMFYDSTIFSSVIRNACIYSSSIETARITGSNITSSVVLRSVLADSELVDSVVSSVSEKADVKIANSQLKSSILFECSGTIKNAHLKSETHRGAVSL